MFRDHAVILKMFDLDPVTIHPGNFYLIDIIQKDHHDLIEKARRKKSYAVLFYYLARIFRDERSHKIKMQNHYGLPKTKLELK